jgi:hypothetical protein
VKLMLEFISGEFDGKTWEDLYDKCLRVLGSRGLHEQSVYFYC